MEFYRYTYKYIYEGKMKKVIKNGTVKIYSSVFYRMNVLN